MAIHDTSVKEFEEVSKTTSIPQYNNVKNSQSVTEIIKLSDDLAVQCFSIKKQINKELLQGRHIPKKLRKWMMEADSLKSQVRNILLLGKGLSNSIGDDEELVEMSTKIVNHLNHCPLVGELVYKKPITVTRMTDKSGAEEISVEQTEIESIFELGTEQISSSGRGNILEEASSDGNDVLVS